MASIANDPRFKLGRALVSGQGASPDDASGGADAAIDVFHSLLEGCIKSDGDGEPSVDTALVQYEYGNALFRRVVRRTPLRDNEDDGDKKPAVKMSDGQREVLAAAALKRSAPGGDANPTDGKRAKAGDGEASIHANGDDGGMTGGLDGQAAETKGDDDDAADDAAADDDPDAVDLSEAKELLEASVVALSHAANKEGPSDEQKQWATEQFPTVLTCIGDLLSYSGEYGNAVDVYCQVLPYREEAWNGTKQTNSDDWVDRVRCQRLLAETNARIAEALLNCPSGEDVVCFNEDDDDESSEEKKPAAGKVLVPANERLSFAETYYEEARLALESILTGLARASISYQDLGEERKNLQQFATLLTGVGNDLVRLARSEA